MRKQILEILFNEIVKTGLFKSKYLNIIPAVTIPKRFPAIAIAIDNEKRERINFTDCKFQNELTIIVMVYQKNKQHDYTDNISFLVEEIEDVINNSDILNSLVIDIWVNKITQDGGILHPIHLSEIEVKVIYRN